jgi:hypothetical protein
MMKTAKILGFASCLLGLLPLLEPARLKAQPAGAAICNQVVVASATASTTLPVLLNPANARIVVCGYGISEIGTATATGAQLLWGNGSACTTFVGALSNLLSVPVPPGQGFERTAMGIVLPQGASICIKSDSNTTQATAEINYSLQ